jgi:hypothetical protein
LQGQNGAWEELYHRCHLRLAKTIESLLGDGGDAGTVDEIAARVWFALVRDDFRLLATYDSERDVRLSTFLSGVARIEIMRFFRAERRRQVHESRGGRRLLRLRRSAMNFDAVMQEFAATLTDAEKELLERDLSPRSGSESEEAPPEDAGDTSLSRSAIYQRRHRLRGKLREFFDND